MSINLNEIINTYGNTVIAAQNPFPLSHFTGITTTAQANTQNVNIQGDTTPLTNIQISVVEQPLVSQSSVFTNDTTLEQSEEFTFSEATTDTITTTRTDGVDYNTGVEASVGGNIGVPAGGLNFSTKVSFSTKISYTNSTAITNTKTTTWTKKYTAKAKPNTRILAEFIIMGGTFNQDIDVDIIMSGSVIYQVRWDRSGGGPSAEIHQNGPLVTVPIAQIFTGVPNVIIRPDGTVQYKGKVNLRGRVGLRAYINLTEQSLTGAVPPTTTTIPADSPSSRTVLFA